MKAIKLLIILIVGAIAFCINANFAYADNNSFASGTLVSTTQGNIAIEKLNPGDRIIGYDFEKHQNKISKISSIGTKSSFSRLSKKPDSVPQSMWQTLERLANAKRCRQRNSPEFRQAKLVEVA